MANTFTQIYIHAVFAVQNRESLITERFREELYRYTTGIVTNQGHKLLRIGGVADHVHLLIGMKPTQAVSDLCAKLKSGSSKFINEKRLVRGRFRWQEGFGAFSCSHSHLDRVIAYIANQEAHHGKRGLRAEFVTLLRRHGVEFDERYLWEPVELGGTQTEGSG